MLRKSLATLPQTLDQTYDRILTAISEDDRNYAMRILQWLTFSARPLSIEEVAEVVAIDVTGNPAFDRDEVLEDPLEALNICSSLVTVTTNKAERSLSPPQRIIALAHYSVQEYLVSERIKLGQAKQFSMEDFKCHDTISKGCLMYLLQFQQTLSTEVLGASALARYVAEFWSSHIRKTQDETEGSLLAINLMSADNPAYHNWIKLYDPDRPWAEPDLRRGLDSVATPLYFTATLGLSTITKMLLHKGAEVNAQGGEYSNALQAASYRGHEQVIKMLLDNKAGVNAQGGYYGNALQAASAGGHEQVVKMLLHNKAEVNAQGGRYGNATHAAAYGGHTETIDILLTSGSISQLQDHYGRTLLWWAAAGGKTSAVEALINRHHIDPGRADNFGRKPSWIAVKKGHGAVSTLLTHDGESNIEPTVPYEWDNDGSHLECDVCTSRISGAALHFHCNLCAGGDWDVCEVCYRYGAICVETAHVLVKRTMVDGLWSEVTS